MKKLYLLLITILMLSLCGCQKEEQKQEEQGDNQEQTDDVIGETIELGDTFEDHFVVYVDPGHGFDDPGCSSTLLKGVEAENTLAIAKILKAKLEEAGAEVYLTHDGVTYPTVQEICALADKHKLPYDTEYIKDNNIFSASERALYMTALCEDRDVDFFISLHINSIEGYPERSRYELYYCETNPEADNLKTMCQQLGMKFDNLTHMSAMTFEDAYAVVKYAPVPSLLVEMGYCTNEKDTAKLNSDTWREEFCDTLTEEIMLWKDENET